MRLRFILSISLCSFLLSFYAFIPVSSASETNQVAIIIDDFGGNVKGVRSFLDGDIPITVAVMPFMEQSTDQAILAHKAGLEVMIHMPMEPKKGKASWLGPNAITSDLTNDEVRKRVLAAIENVPYAKGINNHMGSKIVEDERIMRVILEVARENGLYVIDSGTSSSSVIPKLSEEMNIPYAKRSIFIDDTHSSRQHVNKQMNSLLKIAQKHHKAIAIGHVGVKGNETYSGISNSLSTFKKEQVEIVPVSHILETTIDKDHSRFWHPKEGAE
ncbi:divergent polysaccharide deacetylase family protein [Alkalihalobacillus sp. MEB130]|uniref:divergent polysaccharide deacetylase family protein n=1 Tax=Alkalihalobacillus sp. MEB130 TaxID=2976704 RepID=UPI0028DD50A9|nr:divergent polysaccharide deacetylase family protein [Alkalihalobacillus sp. MEB130]MDT8859882.1 divergent polysaccharide deacetylase family protein [Alkalihalobacillus sp. MEB130]